MPGEYIDFDSLLPEAMYPARYGANPTPAFTLRLSQDPSIEEGEVVIAQQKPAFRRTIRDLVTWMEAWNLYAQVLVAAFPTRAAGLPQHYLLRELSLSRPHVASLRPAVPR